MLAASDFYALMPGDNAATVAVGAAVQFPQNGATLNSSIVRATASTFTVVNAGLYWLQFQVSVSEAGQLAIANNGNTVVGRATGTSQIVGSSLLQLTCSLRY